MSAPANGAPGRPVPADRPEEWPVHDTEDVWSTGAPFSVHLDEITAPGTPDERFSRLVLQHPGAVAVLALDDDDNVLVLEQYRHPVRARLVELPAGLLDVEGEDPLTVARRELREEALLEADQWDHLLSTYTSPGLSSERLEVFVARGITAVEDRGDFTPEHEEADMETAWVPLGELVRGVFEGRLADGPLALAVLAYTSAERPSGR